MKKVTILRKWDNPEIVINVEDSGIGIEMPLESFLLALVDRVTEPLVARIVEDAGNPSMWFTKAALVKNLTTALEGDRVQHCFLEAANVVLSSVKLESSKVM